MSWLPRSAWTDAPRIPGRVTWSQIKIVDIHWPASRGVVGSTPAEVASALRAWRRFHMHTRGWRDIAYNVGVDQLGRIWELRGWDAQDGGVAGRRDDVTILAILGMAETPTDAMKHGILRAMGHFETLAGKQLRRSWHGALSSTSCPGPALTAWGRAGFPAPTATTKEDDMPLTAAEIEQIATRTRDLILWAPGWPDQPEGVLGGSSIRHLTAVSASAGRDTLALLREVAAKVGAPIDIDEGAIAAALLPGLREAIAAEASALGTPDADKLAEAVVTRIGAKLGSTI